uniref:(northern house mosquito) hypothetical protein n=1 Tax=Culex pipiens TaxID=7175 RepID=A0A8D8FKQ9_CULPI
MHKTDRPTPATFRSCCPTCAQTPRISSRFCAFAARTCFHPVWTFSTRPANSNRRPDPRPSRSRLHLPRRRLLRRYHNKLVHLLKRHPRFLRLKRLKRRKMGLRTRKWTNRRSQHLCRLPCGSVPSNIRKIGGCKRCKLCGRSTTNSEWPSYA